MGLKICKKIFVKVSLIIVVTLCRSQNSKKCLRILDICRKVELSRATKIEYMLPKSTNYITDNYRRDLKLVTDFLFSSPLPSHPAYEYGRMS